MYNKIYISEKYGSVYAYEYGTLKVAPMPLMDGLVDFTYDFTPVDWHALKDSKELTADLKRIEEQLK